MRRYSLSLPFLAHDLPELRVPLPRGVRGHLRRPDECVYKQVCGVFGADRVADSAGPTYLVMVWPVSASRQQKGCGAGTEVPAPLRFQTKVVSRVLQCGLGGVTRPPGTTGEWSRPSPPQSRDETICQPVVEQGVCQYPEKPGNLLQNQHFTGFREKSLRDHCRKMLPRISYQQGVPFRAKPQSSQEKHPEESRPERPQQTHYFHHAVRHQAGSRGNGRCRRPDRTGKCRVDHRSITEEGRDT